jgi:hypothetical protein
MESQAPDHSQFQKIRWVVFTYTDHSVYPAFLPVSSSFVDLLVPKPTRLHIYLYMYIYMYVCMYVCVQLLHIYIYIYVNLIYVCVYT